MSHILHLDASPRGERSHSRRLTQEFVSRWMANHPADTLTYRDLGHEPVPFVSEDWVVGAFAPPESQTPESLAAIATSDALVDEFLKADVIVAGVPMFNFGIPASFKAYIDQIARAGRTFDPATYAGLATGKKMFVITARGGAGYGPGEAMSAMNFHDTYLRAVFGFMGVTDITFINADNLNSGDEVRQSSFEAALGAVQQAVTA